MTNLTSTIMKHCLKLTLTTTVLGEADSHTGDVTMTPVKDFLQVKGDSPRHDDADTPTGNVTITPADGIPPG